jgi:hypothetical protein
VKQIRKRLTYANVMSSIAVFLLLGGATAFAANKIGAKQLQANSVTTAKVKKGAITTTKLKDGSVTTTKIADKAVTGAKIDPVGLGVVPNATSAINATNATNAAHAQNADTVGGQSVVKIFKTLTEGQSNVAVANLAGFNVTVTCNTDDADVTITSPAGPGTVMDTGGVASGGDETTFDYESSEPGDTGDIRVDELSAGGGDATYGNASVTLATSNGASVSGDIGYDYNTFSGTPDDTCIVYGHLIAG